MRKLPIATLFCTVFLGGMGITYVSAHEGAAVVNEGALFTPFTGEIKGNRVRLRLAPHTDGSIIRELSKGDLVAVVGESRDYYVVSAPEGIKGYVFRSFVLDNVIEGEQVNVRLEPSTSAPVLARLARGSRVDVIESPASGKWIEIALPKQCVFYVAKNFVLNKGAISLYEQQKGQKRIAMDLLDSAVAFARKELQKDISQIDLDAIYKKINLVQTEEFSGILELQPLIQKALSEIQDAYLAKSLEKKPAEAKEEQPVSLVPDKEQKPSVPSKEKKVSGSLLSHHIRKQISVKSSPVIQGRESFEYSLYKIWADVHAQEHPGVSLTQEAFYKDEQKKKQILVGELELYPHIVKNKPGDYLLRNGEDVLAFVYATTVDLEAWVGKKVTVECLPRPNNHFAFPAYYVVSVKEAQS